MKCIKGKNLYKIIYIILSVGIWVFLLWKANAINETAIEDDIWGHNFDFAIGSIGSAMIILLQLWLYHSTAYLIFEPQKRLWKVIVNAVILTFVIFTVIALLIFFSRFFDTQFSYSLVDIVFPRILLGN